MQILIDLENEHGFATSLSSDHDQEKTVLEHIEAAGGTSPFGCRVGSCGTCVAKVTGGHHFLQEPDELELFCASRMPEAGEGSRLLCRAKFLEVDAIKEALGADNPGFIRIVIRKIPIK